MPKLSINVPHQLGQADAAHRVSGLMDALARKYADQIKIVEQDFGETSGTFAFKTMGMTIKGKAEVEESCVKIDCDLPLAAMMFKGRIEKELREALEKILKG
jgi:hypothetical protein